MLSVLLRVTIWNDILLNGIMHKVFFCVCTLLNYILPTVILVKVILLNVVAPSYRFIVLAAQDDLQFGS